MKKILVLVSLIPYFVTSQLTDTTCIKSRWLALNNDEFNEKIFLHDSIENLEEIDIVLVIKRLLDENKINLYTQKNSVNDEQEWQILDYSNEVKNSIKDTSLNSMKDPYFQIKDSFDIVDVDENGELLVDVSGNLLIHYTLDIFYYLSNDCNQIRIQEDYLYNETTDKFEFLPVGICFYVKNVGSDFGHEKFWVDLHQLFDILEDKERYPWYKAIVNREYFGFQYMQKSCYESERKY